MGHWEAPPPDPIEVEAKFAVGPGTEAALAALGAVGLPHCAPFRDCYFDGPAAPLGRADVWLRHRQGQGWQIKLPHGDTSPHTPRPPSPAPPSAVTAYREVWGDAGVLAELRRIFGVPPSAPWRGVGEALGPLGLRPTASFVTRRRSARLGGLRVELDEADFGYGLGEVEEVVLGGPQEVAEARRRVEGVCRALGEFWGGSRGSRGWGEGRGGWGEGGVGGQGEGGGGGERGG
uniref:CYTH domain-containing protein n=1 Tax=Accipiter nisus TaxID=211598 RepID=A0A8B9S0J7_9AVES